MTDFAMLDRRPIIVAVAGPNGAGKTTFFHAHLAPAGLRFVNADDLVDELAADAYQAARLADALRRALVAKRESFVFETVFSDPVGDKIAFLKDAVQSGYEVVLCYIGLSNSQQSIERVSMRVSQGGHDVPDDKLRARFPRILNNLRQAIAQLPHVLVYDNGDLTTPYRLAAVFNQGMFLQLQEPVPEWLQQALS
jgi:predicted ABC-type ATPase